MRRIDEVIYLDFETFFSDDFTLKKETTESYVRSERFEPLLCAFRRGNGDTEWVGQDDLPVYLSKIDWSVTGVVCHHAQFDGLILSSYYGVKPAFWFDTLSMARAVIGTHVSVALGSLAGHYGLEPKSVPYEMFKGKRWADLDNQTRRQLGEGAVHDVELTWDIFQRLLEGFPLEELEIIDLTVRMFVEPVLRGDVDLLNKIVVTERDRKFELMNRLGVMEKDLQSADKFKAILEDLGVDVEMKTTAAGNSIPAVAKTDQFMKDLLDDADETVSGLAQARLDVRSTIDETRAGRLASMATRGPMPVYLAYHGAHTGRWSGGDRVNWQNFRRGSVLRRAIAAPVGCKLVVVDLSQIECRVLNWLAGQNDVVDNFRLNKDPYVGVASRYYGREITKADKNERQFGKVLELGCGYGLGWRKLQIICRQGPLGGAPMLLTDQEAEAGIKTYRDSHQGVTKLWKEADYAIRHLYSGIHTWWHDFEILGGRFILPNGLSLNYSTLKTNDDGEWVIKSRQGWTKVYGGKLVENIVQALARVVMSQAMLRIQRLGIRLVNTTHDELLAVARESDAEAVYAAMIEEMTREVSWAPGLPLAAEGGISERYEK